MSLRKQYQEPPPPDTPSGEEPPPVSEEGKKCIGFDPTGLERAAKAARELDKSPHAKSALELAQLQERTEQVKHQEVIKRAQHQDQLARRHNDDQLAQQRQLQEESLKKQEDSVQKQEVMRRGTIEYEAELRHKNEIARLEMEIKGKTRMERENQDLALEQIRLKAAEQRTTVLESIKAGGALIGQGINSFITDWDKISAAAAGITLVAIGVYTARMGTGVAGRFIEARLGKPSLIRETSRLSASQTILHPFASLKRLFTKSSDPLAGIVLKPHLDECLRSLSKSTINTKRNGGVYKNVLMYGPPGTGKTMFAKGLARHSGMDYAVLTGGDIAPLGKDAVTAIHKVFDWANTSKKGVILFVDEADAFLRKRKQVAMTEDLRSALNAFLYRTGETSRRFMLVLASNLPDQFDWAINDRLDDLVKFDLPGREERLRMLKLYFSLYVIDPPRITWWKRPRKIPLPTEVNWEEKFNRIAEQIEGFSGREISKLAVAWQARAYGSQDGVLTEAMIDECVNNMMEQHKQKAVWHEDKS